MKKANLLLLATAIVGLGSSGVSSMHASADSVSKENTSLVKNVTNQKAILFQDSFKNGLDYWNVTGIASSGTNGLHLSPGASMKLKYPIFLQAGETYDFQFLYGTTGPSSSKTEGTISFSTLNGGDTRVVTFTSPPGGAGQSDVMKQTLYPKTTGYYTINFYARPSNERPVNLRDFSFYTN